MKKLILVAAFASVSPLAFTQDFQGVSGILKAIAEKSGKPAEKVANPVEELSAKVKSLREEAGKLAPAEAAKRWVALLEAYLAISQEQLYAARSYEDRMSLSMVVTALPPSAAWDGIATLLAGRKTDDPFQDGALRLLLAALRGDAAGRDQAVDAMKEQLKTRKGLDSYQRQTAEQYIEQITTALKQLAGTDAEKIAAFETLLGNLEKGDAQALRETGGGIEVPDLVRFADEKTATDLLTRLIKAGPESVMINGRATRLLAASLALKHVNALKKPLWDLVSTLDHAALYEAMAAKFPESKDRNRQNAAEVYLLALIAAGRTEEAVKFITEEEGDSDGHVSIVVRHLDAMKRQGLGKQVHAFLHQILVKDATLPYWPQYIELSASESASAGALKLLQESLAKPALKAESRAAMQSHYYMALLAADQREEGLRVLQELVKAGPSKAKAKRSSWGGFDDPQDRYFRLCITQATLGRLLGKPQLIDEAITAALATFEQAAKEGSERNLPLSNVIDLLLDHGRGPLAEQVLTQRLVQTVTQEKPQNPYSSSTGAADEMLLLLVSVYDRTGRPKDVLEVLERMPYWTSAELADYGTNRAGNAPLLVAAGRALLDSGRKEEAARVARRAVQDSPQTDSAYELLLRVDAGQPLLDFLDQVAKRDRFEERPLIWKARVLLDAGKVDDAEKTVRAAISIDPSDGEQGKGDRMRAYAILAEVLDKKGDAETAKVMRGAVTAIRKSEDADDWWSAGLLSEAVRRYESALLDFADAYCIQSRLALRYSDLGQFDKAEQHYLRAFELMPDSFGRVESHCFGCEGAFNGLRAQGIADKVFTRLANLPPVKAQVYYLLGYLRSAQDRDMEAADAFRQAVKTDPDYLNAWEKLSGLAETAQMTRAESENATLQIFRLDPTGHRSHPRLQDLRDLRLLWTTLLAAEAGLPVDETGPLLTLPAAKQQSQDGNNIAREIQARARYAPHREDPRNHLLQNRLIATLVQFVENSRNR